VNRIIKYIILIFTIITILILFYLFLNEIGIFNFYYEKKFIGKGKELDNEFKKFTDEMIRITSTISEDPLLKSAFLQYKLGENLLPASQTIDMYIENYEMLKNVMLFNTENKIILSGFSSFIQTIELQNDYFNLAVANKFYITPIYFNSELNLYLIDVLLTFFNTAGEPEGFVKTSFSLNYLFEKMNKFKNLGFLIIDNSRSKINFIFPLDFKFKNDESIYIPFSEELERIENKFILGRKIKNSFLSIVIFPKDNFFDAPLILKILLIFSIFINILCYSYFILDKIFQKSKERKDRLKRKIDEIVKVVHTTAKESIAIIESSPKEEELFVENKEVVENKTENEEKYIKKSEDFKLI